MHCLSCSCFCVKQHYAQNETQRTSAQARRPLLSIFNREIVEIVFQCAVQGFDKLFGQLFICAVNDQIDTLEVVDCFHDVILVDGLIPRQKRPDFALRTKIRTLLSNIFYFQRSICALISSMILQQVCRFSLKSSARARMSASDGFPAPLTVISCSNFPTVFVRSYAGDRR